MTMRKGFTIIEPFDPDGTCLAGRQVGTQGKLPAPRQAQDLRQARKGFTLIELIVACTLLVALATTTGYVLKDLIVDVPKSNRAVEVDKALCRMLRLLRMDIDSAGSVSPVGSGAGRPAELRIALPKHTVRWRLEEGGVTRTVSGPDPPPAGRRQETWKVPCANLRWQVWERDGRPFAVEVRTSVDLPGDASWRNKLAKTHVYFLGALPGEADR